MGRNRGFFAYFYAIRAEVFPDFVDLHKMEGGNRGFFGISVVLSVVLRILGKTKRRLHHCKRRIYVV